MDTIIPKDIKQLGNWINKISKYDPNNTYYHIASTSSYIFGLMFLMKKHSNDCFIIKELDVDLMVNDYYDYNNLNQFGMRDIFNDKRFSPIHLDVISDMVNKKNIYEIDFCCGITFLQEQIKVCKTRFVIIIFDIVYYEKRYTQYISTGGHANLLLLDTKLKTLERFDPNYGTVEYITDKSLSQVNIDKYLSDVLQPIFPDYIYIYANIDVPFGPQSLQVYETIVDSKQNDPTGYCVAWSLLYADLRLTYPDISKKKIMKIFSKNILDEEIVIDITDFIRSYAIFINNERKRIESMLPKKYEKILNNKNAKKDDVKIATKEYFNIINAEIVRLIKRYDG